MWGTGRPGERREFPLSFCLLREVVGLGNRTCQIRKSGSSTYQNGANTSISLGPWGSYHTAPWVTWSHGTATSSHLLGSWGALTSGWNKELLFTGKRKSALISIQVSRSVIHCYRKEFQEMKISKISLFRECEGPERKTHARESESLPLQRGEDWMPLGERDKFIWIVSENSPGVLSMRVNQDVFMGKLQNSYDFSSYFYHSLLFLWKLLCSWEVGSSLLWASAGSS